MTAVAYAPKGLIGVLTPQANTTVEPEFSILCPPGHAYINARMTSDGDTIEARLVDYAERAETHIRQFANAPVAAAALAATGASYLIGPDREDALVRRVQSDRDLPLVTAARAVVQSLETLGARRIGLISPYPPALTEASEGYWRARGFEVGGTVSAFSDTGAFHPIYALDAEAAGTGLDALRASDVDAVLMLGTGMPTLDVIAAAAEAQGPPVVSCMLALVWAAVLAAAGRSPDRGELEGWIRAEHWRGRLPA